MIAFDFGLAETKLKMLTCIQDCQRPERLRLQWQFVSDSSHQHQRNGDAGIAAKRTDAVGRGCLVSSSHFNTQSHSSLRVNVVYARSTSLDHRRNP